MRRRGLTLASGSARADAIGRLRRAHLLGQRRAAPAAPRRSACRRSPERSTRTVGQREVRRDRRGVALVLRDRCGTGRIAATTWPGAASCASRATTAESIPPLSPTTNPRAPVDAQLRAASTPQSARPIDMSSVLDRLDRVGGRRLRPRRHGPRDVAGVCRGGPGTAPSPTPRTSASPRAARARRSGRARTPSHIDRPARAGARRDDRVDAPPTTANSAEVRPGTARPPRRRCAG